MTLPFKSHKIFNCICLKKLKDNVLFFKKIDPLGASWASFLGIFTRGQKWAGMPQQVTISNKKFLESWEKSIPAKETHDKFTIGYQMKWPALAFLILDDPLWNR